MINSTVKVAKSNPYTGKKIYSRGGVIKRLFAQRFTIMLVPHTEKRTIHFQISFLLLILFLLLSFSLIAGFFWFSFDFSSKEILLAARARDLADAEASLDIIRGEVSALVDSTGTFRASLARTMGVLGINNDSESVSDAKGDLASLFTIEKSEANTLAEVSELKNLKMALNSSAGKLEDISYVLAGQKELLSDIPTIWPLKGVNGWVTQIFGPSRHPRYGYWYLHRGLDLGFGYGVPIVATASGKIIKKEYDSAGFGYYLDVQHKYGFKTRYAHLQRQMVEVGQEVLQGDVIATMGSSGNSTGPHLHYEVMIGTQLVDPVKFFSMARQNRSSRKISTRLRKYQ